MAVVITQNHQLPFLKVTIPTALILQDLLIRTGHSADTSKPPTTSKKCTCSEENKFKHSKIIKLVTTPFQN
jgi:hypothetical protein